MLSKAVSASVVTFTLVSTTVITEGLGEKGQRET